MEKEKSLFVCEHCLMAIESREGKQMVVKHYKDDEEDETEFKCEWCGNEDLYELYELI